MNRHRIRAAVRRWTPLPPFVTFKRYGDTIVQGYVHPDPPGVRPGA